MKTPLTGVVSTLNTANANINKAEFSALGPLVGGLSSQGCSNLSPVKCQGSDAVKQAAYRKDVKDKLDALKAKIATVNNADPQIAATGMRIARASGKKPRGGGTKQCRESGSP